MKKLMVIATAVIMVACKTNDKKAVTGTAGAGGNDSNGQLSSEDKNKAINDTLNYTTIQWIDSINANLGKLVKDQSIEVSFRFKNTGTKNLIFQDVSAPCGCTIPEKPEKPFAPGEEGVIRAKFNGSGNGHITKQIHVKANTKPFTDHNLTFEGDVQ